MRTDGMSVAFSLLGDIYQSRKREREFQRKVDIHDLGALSFALDWREASTAERTRSWLSSQIAVITKWSVEGIY